MSRNVLTAFVVVAVSALVMKSSSSDVCQRRDCDRYDAPSSKDRVCRMHNTSDYAGLEWYTGTLNSTRCNTFAAKLTSRDAFSKFCPGYVGMSMSLWCDFVNVASVIYKNGEPLTNESTVTFTRLQKEDEGLYQCRRHGSLELIAEFNMTVQNEVHIGGTGLYECIPFYCNTDLFNQQKCCYYGGWRPSIAEDDMSTPLTLSIYGDSPINMTASTYWITDPNDHYPTDLGLRLERNKTDDTLLEIYIDHYPQSVTRAVLQVIVMISATNRFSSFSTCNLVVFDSTGILSTDPSLPQDVFTAEGGDAKFSCEFGTNQPGPLASPQPIITLKFVYGGSKGNTSQSIITTNCSSWMLCKQWAPPDSFPYSTTISLIHVPVINLSNYMLHRYETHLTNVSAELNGSTFSCSIATPKLITRPRLELIKLTQWERSAELIVALKDESTPSASSDRGGHSHGTNLAPMLVPLSVILVLLLIISGIVVGLVAWKRHQTHQGHHSLAGMGNWEALKSKEDFHEH